MIRIENILSNSIITNEEYKNKILTTIVTDKNDDGTILYEMNEHGYRSKSLSSIGEYNILTLGCSWTMGIGVYNDNTWPNVINELFKEHYKLNSCVFNYGMYGSSTSYVSKLLYKILNNNFKPDMVLIMWPGFSRRDYIKEDGTFKKIGGFRRANNNDIVWKNEDEDNLFLKLRNDSQDLMIFWESYKFVEILCKLYNIKIYHTIAGYYYDVFKSLELYDTIDNNKFFLPVDCYKNDMGGRDGQHPSGEWHKKFANNFFKFIINENNI